MSGWLPPGTTDDHIDRAVNGDPDALPRPIVNNPCRFGLCNDEAGRSGFCEWHHQIAGEIAEWAKEVEGR